MGVVCLFDEVSLITHHTVILSTGSTGVKIMVGQYCHPFPYLSDIFQIKQKAVYT